MVRFDPDSLRAPARLLPESQNIAFRDERGAGLPAVLDAIINRDVDSFMQLQEGLKDLFPAVKKLGLSNTTGGMKELAVTLADDTALSRRP